MKLARYNSSGDVHTYIHDDRAYSEVMTSVRLSIVISPEYLHVDTCTHRSWQPEAATEQGTHSPPCPAQPSKSRERRMNRLPSAHTHARDFISEKPETGCV